MEVGWSGWMPRGWRRWWGWWFGDEVDSAMYKGGIRWTEYMESETIGKHDEYFMVLDYILTILTISIIILMVS